MSQEFRHGSGSVRRIRFGGGARRFLFGAIILWFVLEWYLFGLISQSIGIFPTIVLSIAKGGFGLLLLGFVLRRMRVDMREILKRGQRPIAVIEPALAVLGAILICIPGFVPTIFGLALFAPSVRSLVMQRFRPGSRGAEFVELDRDEYREVNPEADITANHSPRPIPRNDRSRPR